MVRLGRGCVIDAEADQRAGRRSALRGGHSAGIDAGLELGQRAKIFGEAERITADYKTDYTAVGQQ
jgi:hypothetical protein